MDIHLGADLGARIADAPAHLVRREAGEIGRVGATDAERRRVPKHLETLRPLRYQRRERLPVAELGSLDRRLPEIPLGDDFVV